jgi:hypothetical protein
MIRFKQKNIDSNNPNKVITYYWQNNIQPPLLLDLYPNAAAAYSLRKLRNAYIGSAIRVRRSSDNVEQDIGFDIFGDLDSATLTTFCTGTNGFITTWYDQSTVGRNATQTTAIRQPQIVASGNITNDGGKPALTFNGNYWLEIVNRPLIGLTQYAFFAVANAQLPDTYEMLFTQSNAGGNSACIEFRRNLGGNNIQILDSSANGFVSVGSINQRSLYSVMRNSTTTKLYFNGVFDSQNISVISPVGNFISNIGGRVNGQFLYNGLQQEMIIYANDQTANQINIDGNIKTYYGIP